MKKVEIKGYVIYDERELNHGSITGAIDHELFNVDGVCEWLLEEESCIDVEWNEEDDDEEY